MALLAAQAKEAGSLLGPPTTTVVAVVVVVVWARDPNETHKTDQNVWLQLLELVQSFTMVPPMEFDNHLWAPWPCTN